MIDTEDEPPKPDPAILRKLIDAPFPVAQEGAGECCPTEDGPGQCANGCPVKTPYGDAVCGNCLTRSLEDGPADGAGSRPPYERRKTNREGV